ncbi:MAG TPA: DUF4097 family beta strand repeat-containing protein [Thermoanaerobaculia bacterium]|jgi:DUF4097 and DUF4098 domain-containing protein YvlB
MTTETRTAFGRLSWAMNDTRHSPLQVGDAPAARANRWAIWILLALGLLLMLVSASVGQAQTSSLTRVDRFNGTLRSGQTIHVENISGDVIAAPGKEFSAVVTVQVSAPSDQKAKQLLDATRVVTDHDEDGWSLETHWPGARGGGSHGGDRHVSLCSGCKVTAKYELVIPAGVTAELQTVNGDVRVRDCNGEMKLASVNGAIEARGVRASLEANTVNGRIDALVAAIPKDASFGLQSVNGPLVLTLPKDARFDLSASTMNGTIASTFALPVRDEVVETPRHGKGNRTSHERRVIVHSEDGETEVDLGQLEEELQSTMQDAEAAIEEGTREGVSEGMREAQREVRRIRIVDPRQEYSGSVGNGGVDVKLETLNGAIAVLAEGTKESDAKRLVTRRNSFAVTIPEVRVRVNPAPPVPPAPPVGPVPPAPRAPSVHPAPPVPPEPPDFEGEVVRGDVSGDFLSTTSGSYRVGRVSGRVKILTHSGEIRLGAAGAGADLKTFGGDIIVGPVTGDLKASTAAGDIRAQTITGSFLADTAGGDVRAERVGASLDAKTSGGDIVALRVGGGIRAVTAGGDVRIGVLSSAIPGGVSVHNSGGDVTLWLPADCKADVDLSVVGVDEDESAIRSDFPDVTVTRRQDSQRATAKLNGGGEKIVVRTTSGTIRLRKGNPT